MATPSLVDDFKDKVWELLQQRPFYPFRIVVESGDVLVVEHPENFAMWPGPETNTFHVYSQGGRGVYSHFEKITAVEFLDSTDT